MEVDPRLLHAARELVRSLPPPSESEYRDLMTRLRAMAAHRAATAPDAVARSERVTKLLTDKRLTCERYLGNEITLETMVRRLRFLEIEERRTDGL